jgi:hypothetical protein
MTVSEGLEEMNFKILGASDEGERRETWEGVDVLDE